MKRALIWLPLGLFGVFFAVVAAGLMRPADTAVHSTLVDKPLPVFTLEPMVPGKPGLASSDFRGGKPRLLNVFASWCIPCIAEAPQLMALKARGVPIDAIAIHDKGPAIAAFLRVGRAGDLPDRRARADRAAIYRRYPRRSGRPDRSRYGRRTMSLSLALLLAAATATPDYGNTQLPDRRVEAQARALMGELRCVVCQGQSIADSDADMAADMRALVRQRIARGESPEAIRAWLIERYGDYVSYDPPLSGATALLWATPILLLAIGAWIARSSFRKRR
jgi:cytochrome c-type biogenesis protein CcmH/NrfF